MVRLADDARRRRNTVRVTASLVQPSGAEVLKYDSGSVGREAAAAGVREAIDRICDEMLFTIDEGLCAVVLRIEPTARLGS